MPPTRRSLRPLATLAAALALGGAGCFDVASVSSATPQLTSQVTDWRDEMIYQVIVDRFADGDPGNNWRVDNSSLARYQGGDWQGLTNHLDYIQSLGVTTLWISPIVRNVDTDSGIDGYHGYWASDLAELNPHFGDLGSLRAFVQACHTRGLRVVLDIVTNHMGQMFYYDINQNGRPDQNVYGGGPNNGFENPGGMGSTLNQVNEFDPDYNLLGPVQSYSSLGPAGPAPVIFLQQPDIFRVPPHSERACDPNTPLQNQPDCNDWQAVLGSPDGYHRRGRIVNYDYDSTGNQPGEQTLHGDFPGGLKDVASENPDVRRAMIQAYARWVELADFDGLRIDTLKHVEHDFWQEFAPALRQRLASEGKTNFFMFGEAFDGNDTLIGSYTQPNEMDSVFYFSQKFSVYRDVFQCELPTHNIETFFGQRASHFGATPQPMGANAAPQQLLVNFFDNHDVARFLDGVQLDTSNPGAPDSCPLGHVASTADMLSMRNHLYAALAFLYTEDGIPCLYGGTEQECHGGNDPSNREPLWQAPALCRIGDDAANSGGTIGAYDTRGNTFQYIARLTRLRHAYSALRRGAMAFKWSTMNTGSEQDAGIVAFERADGDSKALVVINAHSAGPSATSATSSGGGAMMTDFAAGTTLVDVLQMDPTLQRTTANAPPAMVTVGDGGALTVSLGPWEAAIYVPAAQVVDLPGGM